MNTYSDLPTEHVDLLVIGAGAAGMTTALCASIEGLKVLLCEKTDQVGGALSTSGGTTWVPGNSLGARVDRQDTIEEGARFLEHTVGDRGGLEMRRAFLQSGATAIDYLAQHSEVKFEAAKEHPDYLDGPGFAFGGRALSPLAFDGKQLKGDFDRVRPPRDEFMGLGGMMVSRYELGKLLAPFKSFDNLKTTLKLVGKYYLDRLNYKRGTRFLMGNALAGRLYYSLLQRSVPISFNTNLVELIREDDVVVGAVIDTPDGRKSIRAKSGVVLSTGGISWNLPLRSKYFPTSVAQYSLAPRTNTGDGADAALKLGARFNDGGDSPALWMPCSTYRRADGRQMYWPHILLDRAKPGLLAVRRDGRRFVNEADSYHDFCIGQLKDGGTHPAYLICDHSFLMKYGLGFVLPGGKGKRALEKCGYLESADTIEKLATRLQIDITALKETISNYNQYAETGDDLEFHRGTTIMNRFNGDASNKPNPCLAKIGNGPFYAVKVEPVDLACSAGIEIDEYCRVLNENSQPIRGLFACGNDATSIFRGTYPGPGTTLGPHLTFAWRLVQFVSGKLN